MSKVIGGYRKIWKCAICGEVHTGWGNNPAPIMDYNSALVCDKCNQMVLACRMLKLQMKKRDIYKTIDRAEYKKIKFYAAKHGEVRPIVKFLDGYFKGTDIDKITDPIDYGDLVDEEEFFEDDELFAI